MATCEECIHYEACEWFGFIYVEEMADDCLRFKPKSRFIELPCEVGQVVFSIEVCLEKVFVGEVYEIFLSKHGIVYRSSRKGYYNLAFPADAIGKTVFLTKEEAEKALEERNKK